MERFTLSQIANKIKTNGNSSIHIVSSFELTEFATKYIENNEMKNSFVIIDCGKIIMKLNEFQTKWNDLKVFISLEYQSEIPMIEIMKEYGVDFAITSSKQVRLYDELSGDIIDTCQSRTKESIRVGLENKALFTVENEYQKEQLKSLKCSMLLYFGVNDSEDERGLTCEECESMLDNSCNVVGIYFCPNELKSFDMLSRLLDVGQTRQIPLKYIYIGNDFLSTDGQHDLVLSKMSELSQKYHIQFHANISADIMNYTSTLVSRICGKRLNPDHQYLYLNDGLYGTLHNCMLDKSSLFFIQSLTMHDDSTISTTLFGPTCDSLDTVISNVQLPHLDLNEWLCLTTNFCPNKTTSFNAFQSGAPLFVCY